MEYSETLKSNMDDNWTLEVPGEGGEQLEFPDINHVVVSGRLVQDPPIRKTRRGIIVTNFLITTCPDHKSLDIDECERNKCCVSIVVWGRQAAQCNKYLKKGSRVLIMGELQSMPNFKPQEGFFPVQVSAQWIQYLDNISSEVNFNDEQDDLLES